MLSLNGVWGCSFFFFCFFFFVKYVIMRYAQPELDIHSFLLL